MIFGLAVELVSLFQTTQLSGQITARLNVEAGQARNDANKAIERASKAEENLAEANERAANALKSAEVARKDAEAFRLDIAKANESAARAEERAAEANRKAEEERLARVKIQEKMADRHLTVEQQSNIASKLRQFAGERINVYGDNVADDMNGIATDIIRAIAGSGAGWIPTFTTGQNFANIVNGIAVEISPTADAKDLAASRALVAALQAERQVVIGPRPPSVFGPFVGAGNQDLNAKIKIIIGRKP